MELIPSEYIYSQIINQRKTHPSLEVLSRDCKETKKHRHSQRSKHIQNTYSMNINSRNPHLKLQNPKPVKLGVLTMCIYFKPFLIFDFEKRRNSRARGCKWWISMLWLENGGSIGTSRLVPGTFSPPPPH